MKYIKQFGIITAAACLGELLHIILPFPIPASVYGLLLMLGGLKSGMIPWAAVKDAAGFLIEVMPLMFVPAGVGVITSWTELKPVLVPVLITAAATTVLVMAVTGRITQFVLRRGKRVSAAEKEKLCRNL